jgi:GNAT superfamily N-acetyltransferase
MQAIKRLTRADKIAAAEVLAAAFRDYPVMRYVLKDAGDSYDNHLKALCGFFCEKRLIQEGPLLGIKEGADLVAAAGITAPDGQRWPPGLRKEYDKLAEIIGGAAIERNDGFEQVLIPLVPREPHYYLGIIGVRPEHQKKGYAGQLLERLHEMSSANPLSTGVCLSTEEQVNLSLYQHFGYEIVGEADLGRFKSWCMFRAD